MSPRGRGAEFHIRSPLLANGVLVTAIAGHLRGYDAATGKILWENLETANTGARSVGSDKVVTLGTGATARQVIVTTYCKVLDPRDGKILAAMPYEEDAGLKPGALSGGTSMLSFSEPDGAAVVFKSVAWDNFNGPIIAYRLRATGNTVTVEKAFRVEGGTFPLQGVATTDRHLLIGGRIGIVDGYTGEVVAPVPHGLGTHSMIVAGTTFIAHEGQTDSNSWNLRRPDGKMVCLFTTVDVSDPRQPQPLSLRNVLGSEANPAFPPAQRFLPELWQNPRFVNSCGGRISHLINLDTGMTAAGERLYIRTTGGLVCVGPAVKGTPKDDPKVVAAIHAGQDVAKYLDSDSAQYRYEAVKRLNEVGGGDQKVLEAIARTDPYEEIRAAALRALGLKGEQAGARVLREVLAVALDVRNWQRFEGDALMTLRELGREAEPVLLAMLQGEDQTDRTRAAAIIAGCSWPVGGNVLRDALIPLLPLLKALNSTNVGIVNAIADIERKVEAQKK
jgi:hypothetical protein